MGQGIVQPQPLQIQGDPPRAEAANGVLQTAFQRAARHGGVYQHRGTGRVGGVALRHEQAAAVLAAQLAHSGGQPAPRSAGPPVQHHAVVFPPQALPQDVPRQHVVAAALTAVVHQHQPALRRGASLRRQQPRPHPVDGPHRPEPAMGQRVARACRQIELHDTAPLVFPDEK